MLACLAAAPLSAETAAAPSGATVAAPTTTPVARPQLRILDATPAEAQPPAAAPALPEIRPLDPVQASAQATAKPATVVEKGVVEGDAALRAAAQRADKRALDDRNKQKAAQQACAVFGSTNCAGGWDR